MADDPFDRLTLLERAQLLHDATVRRHGDLLDQHAEAMTHLRALAERQQALTQQLADFQTRLDARQDDLATHQRDHAAHMAALDALAADHTERLARLDAILAAVLDLLRRGRNGS